jgi:endonuclease-3
VIRVYDEGGNVIETHEHAGEFKEWWIFTRVGPQPLVKKLAMAPPSLIDEQGRQRIAQALSQHAGKLYSRPRQLVSFTPDRAANELINDIERYPHAFVFACLMDEQMRAERVWAMPVKMSQRLRTFAFSALAKLSPEELKKVMISPTALHRFPKKMARYLSDAIKQIEQKYGGDAALIWKGGVSSSTVVFRFLQFTGIGPKKATMAANTLARDFKVRFSDYYSIDVSVDVHVRRVFQRLGLIRPKSKVEEVIYSARALNPEFPGLLDLPAWEIGRRWCRPRNPACDLCYMSSCCPTARQRS